MCGYLRVTPRNGTSLNHQRQKDGRCQQVGPRGGQYLSLQWQGVNAVVVYYFSAAHYVALTWIIHSRGRQKNRLVTFFRWVSGIEWVEMKRINATSAMGKKYFFYLWQRWRDVCGVESLNNALICGITRCSSCTGCSEKMKYEYFNYLYPSMYSTQVEVIELVLTIHTERINAFYNIIIV